MAKMMWACAACSSHHCPRQRICERRARWHLSLPSAGPAARRPGVAWRSPPAASLLATFPSSVPAAGRHGGPRPPPHGSPYLVPRRLQQCASPMRPQTPQKRRRLRRGGRRRAWWSARDSPQSCMLAVRALPSISSPICDICENICDISPERLQLGLGRHGEEAVSCPHLIGRVLRPSHATSSKK